MARGPIAIPNSIGCTIWRGNASTKGMVTSGVMNQVSGDEKLQSHRTKLFNGRVTVFAFAVAMIVFLPLVVTHVLDVAYIFFVVPGLILIGACLLLYAAIRKKASIAVFVVSFSVAFAALATYEVKRPVVMRSEIRWMLFAREYKSAVLSQPASGGADFKHIEWDAWGWVPAGDTNVYLVFDPADSLAAASRANRGGKFDGIPCKVPQVHRLESHWYTVYFYTDESWGHCQ